MEPRGRRTSGFSPVSLRSRGLDLKAPGCNFHKSRTVQNKVLSNITSSNITSSNITSSNITSYAGKQIYIINSDLLESVLDCWMFSTSSCVTLFSYLSSIKGFLMTRVNPEHEEHAEGLKIKRPGFT
ncbi:hypothetical protein Q7C36_021598 [Tachysurus vachellii]|uniref:Uncharacterized protein n=1 Tax=Tachysurus vachellii TaxID=175792 RepID=A0AA88J9K0_TACVA|nr:hypothetical protein Q7C36_021598 [Tachysurus vachellii]